MLNRKTMLLNSLRPTFTPVQNPSHSFVMTRVARYRVDSSSKQFFSVLLYLRWCSKQPTSVQTRASFIAALLCFIKCNSCFDKTGLLIFRYRVTSFRKKCQRVLVFASLDLITLIEYNPVKR